jgi:uncharacterized protein YyaL (SSP411 family)
MIPRALPYICLVFLFLLATFASNRALGEEKKLTNRLIHEASPYLLKHATNPVDWYPWGEEAFSQAREKDKPILLSIGYLTCHWCNVMEEESFSDPQVAALINETFIPVKVDREERPDIDQIYMKACYLLSPSCGWPLTIFLSPDGKPFYAGTYIPKENRFGRLGLLELIPRVKQLWEEERGSVQKSADSINAAIVSSTIQLPGDDMGTFQLDNAFHVFSSDFDQQYGGFGMSTKFPKPLNLIYLLRYWHRTGNKEALAMVEKTLAAMREGSIYDHLGYGFHRYATDRMWRMPHFEKMLYDQALLVLAYLEAYQATSKEEYAATAREIIEYVLTYMTAANGGFFSAESADSEGEEGKFYLWPIAEVRKILSPPEAAEAVTLFHMKEDGNFVHPVSGQKTGQNILYSESYTGQRKNFEKIRRKLLAARNKRPRPELDDKILTDWNGLMIAALARAAKVLGQPAYGEAAAKAATFILGNVRSPDGKLLHRWRQGQAGLAGNAADYSFLTWGLLELYGWEFDTRWLARALDLTTILVEDFWDDRLGGFYLTAENGKSMLPRIKESIDTALPSSNAVAMNNLLKLSRITGNPGFAEKADKISRLMSSRVNENELAFPMLLTALESALAPSQEVVIVGTKGADDTSRMIEALRKNYFPNAIVVFKPAGEEAPEINSYADFLEFMNAIDNKATAYVCIDFKCNFPTTDPARMLEELANISTGTKPSE